MSKKLSGNGLWESSRMMLPEHKEAILRGRKAENHHDKPDLDEQVMEGFTRLIEESMRTGKFITITVYDPVQDIKVTGCVQHIDSHAMRIRFFHDFKKTWIPFADIVSVHSYHSDA